MSRRTLCLFPLLTLALACGFFAGEAETPPAVAPNQPTPIPPSSALREPIELRAWSNSNTLRFQIFNNAVEELYVGPENFALISPGIDQPLLATDEQVICRFPPIILGRQESGTGEMVFLSRGDIAGHRLVFNSPQVEPRLWPVDIQDASPPTE